MALAEAQKEITELLRREPAIGGIVSVAHQDFEEGGQADCYTVVQRLMGAEVWSNDGSEGLSLPVITVMPMDSSRSRLGATIQAIEERVNNFSGQVTAGGPMIQMCILDEVNDLYDEESSYYGAEMTFLVAIGEAP